MVVSSVEMGKRWRQIRFEGEEQELTCWPQRV